MIKNILSIFVAMMFMVGSLPAIVYVYSLDTEFSGGADPVGPVPWATATFSQVDAGTVQLELSNINLSGSEFIGAWYFNFNDSLDVNSLSFSRVGGTAPADADISTGLNSFKADGDGYFDIIFDFPQKSADRFAAGDTIVYEISGINPLTMDMFNFDSAPGGGNGSWYSAAHVQSINGEDSGWIGSGPGVAVPEPSTYLMLSSLLGLSLFLVARSRKRKIKT